MKYFFRKVHILLTVYYAYMLEYRSELLLWVLSGSLPIIIMGVWNKAAQGGKLWFKSTGLYPLFFLQYFLF